MGGIGQGYCCPRASRGFHKPRGKLGTKFGSRLIACSSGRHPRGPKPDLSEFFLSCFDDHCCTDPNVDSRRGPHRPLLDHAAWECPHSRGDA
ncbi:hypothetical protein CRG98_021657 [Punica granatum]|uniref:Uncharacterized protein n=1 Tax=Punica granatum TaxID=22663 RepID=A0A2I0JNU2_PUNGR|nr:hypothetical protein CRG98_021657 [Punica granatum]